MTAAQTAARYLEAIAGHDWDSARQCLAEDVVRIGPFGAGDTYRGRQPYIAYLSGLMPTLAEYRMNIKRVIEAEGTTVVELSEQVLMDGKTVLTDECLVFEHDADHLISHLSIYIQKG